MIMIMAWGEPPVDENGDLIEVPESEIFDPVRDERPCEHGRSHLEPSGMPSRSGMLSMVWVCEDCGAEADGGAQHRDSVL